MARKMLSLNFDEKRHLFWAKHGEAPTYLEMAEKSGVSRQTIFNYRRGNLPKPNWFVVAMIAKTFDCSLEELVVDPENWKEEIAAARKMLAQTVVSQQ